MGLWVSNKPTLKFFLHRSVISTPAFRHGGRVSLDNVAHSIRFDETNKSCNCDVT